MANPVKIREYELPTGRYQDFAVLGSNIVLLDDLHQRIVIVRPGIGEEIIELNNPQRHCIASPICSDRRFAAGVGREVHVYDIDPFAANQRNTTVLISDPSRDDPARLSFSNHGGELLVQHRDGRVVLWDVENAKPLDSIEESRTMIRGAALVAAGTLIALGLDSAGLSIVSLIPASKSHELPDVSANSLVTHSTSDKLYVACGDGAIRRVDPVTGVAEHEFVGHRRCVQCLSFTQDGKFLVSGGADPQYAAREQQTAQRNTAAIDAPTGVIAWELATGAIAWSDMSINGKCRLTEYGDLIVLEDDVLSQWNCDYHVEPGAPTSLKVPSNPGAASRIIRARCPSCQHLLKGRSRGAVMKVRCPKCQHKFTIRTKGE